jgi:hypothetical protein
MTGREKILAEISAAADKLMASDPLWSVSEPAAEPLTEGFLDVTELAALMKISRSSLYAKLHEAPFKDFVAPQDGIRRRRFIRSRVMQYLAQGGAKT